MKDLVSGQDTIQWKNHYNKVTSVTQGGPDSSVLRFDYDGMGQRYMKTYVSAINDTTVEKGEYYVRDAQGNILAIYKAESRYELSPVTVWESVSLPAISYVGPAAFINSYLTPAYSNNALYQNYMISTGVEAGLPAQLMGNYTPATLLSSNHALYSGFLSSAEYSGELFQSLREHAEYELGGVSPLSMIVQERSRKDEVYNSKLVQALFGPDAPDEVRQEGILALLATDGPARNLFEALSLSYDEVDPQQNVNLLMERLQDSKAYGDFTRAFHEHIVRAEGVYSAPFYEGLAMNTVLQGKDVLDNYAALMNVWQLGMIQYGYTSELDSFVNNWGATNDVLTQTVAPEVLGNAIYSLAPGPFVQSAYDLSGSNNAVLFGGLNAVYQGSFGLNIAHIQHLLEHHLQYQVPVTTWQNLLKYQHLNLASHHLYGSSRLGTKDYLEGQLYAKVDLTGSQPFMDTLMLTARRPWYSMDYDELITGASQTPWGMAATEPYHFAAQIGQKQYELSNHLGNVQATVSDLPYMATFTQPDSDVPGVNYEPSLRSAYDYYPFGMLMPGRYVSDTTERCMTISRTGWSTILVDSCKPLGVMYAQSYTTGGGSVSQAGGSLVLSVPAAGSIGFPMEVASGVENSFEFNVGKVNGASEQGVLVTLLETIDNVPYVIGGGRLQVGSRQKINFRSTGNNISLVFPEHFIELELAMVCTKYPKSVQHTYLVDVCDESKDRYRFGFNGQEKDNELKGVGNSLDFGARMYDSRVGRWLSLDPLAAKYPFASPYNFVLNTPMRAKDPDGKVVIFINGQHFNDALKGYWNGFDLKVMNRIKDYKALYFDGGLGGWTRSTLSTKGGLFSNDPINLYAKDRYLAGYQSGLANAKDIINNLERNKNGNIIESVKIITHSMGGVYGKGFAEGLKKYVAQAKSHEEDYVYNPTRASSEAYKYPDKTVKGFKIEYEVDFASFQPNSPYNSAVDGVRTIQVSHKDDKVVNNDLEIADSYETKQAGVTEKDYHLNQEKSGHGIATFSNEVDKVPVSTNSNSSQ